MSDYSALSLPELEDRIAILRDNIGNWSNRLLLRPAVRTKNAMRIASRSRPKNWKRWLRNGTGGAQK